MTDNLETLPPIPEEILEAAKDGRLVLFVGAGASMMVGMPSWPGLASAALNSLVEQGYIDYAEFDQLKTLDPKKQLSIADFIAKGQGNRLELTQYLKARRTSSIYPNINSIQATCVTTNYDHELSPLPLEEASEKETKASVERKSGVDNLQAADLKVPGTVIHLHGDMDNHDTMIVTTRDYLAHYDEPKVQHFLSELFKDYVVVFIGYGLEESEILEHILRRSGVEESVTERQRFLLQPFFKNQQSLYERLKVYHQKSFGVHLIGYARDEKDYQQLEDVIELWASKLTVRPPALVGDIEMMDRILNDD
ncbi:SIR2 family protein [Shewanella electrodiphila]|uniref:SIR2 family protein n=1 Tax=Shewanella electrodiphila TaxID=934143 RepID=A0ABT0KLH8_9GAMM|nr:SIR2 family protein [Shewanella electrodiphila]MCL1044702.1 SIR2 family protein [Shewanella electrodiphila]